MLLQLGLPTFNTILHNNRFSFMARVTSSVNVLVQSTLMCCWIISVSVSVLLSVCLFIVRFYGHLAWNKDWL